MARLSLQLGAALVVPIAARAARRAAARIGAFARCGRPRSAATPGAGRLVTGAGRWPVSPFQCGGRQPGPRKLMAYASPGRSGPDLRIACSRMCGRQPGADDRRHAGHAQPGRGVAAEHAACRRRDGRARPAVADGSRGKCSRSCLRICSASYRSSGTGRWTRPWPSSRPASATRSTRPRRRTRSRSRSRSEWPRCPPIRSFSPSARRREPARPFRSIRCTIRFR